MEYHGYHGYHCFNILTMHRIISIWCQFLSSWWQHPTPRRVASTKKMQRFRLAIFPLAKLLGLFSSKSLTFHVGRRKNVGGTEAAVFQNAGQVWISVDWIGVDDMDMYQRYVQMLISMISNPGILSRIYPTFQANCDDRWPSKLYNWQSLLWKWKLCMNHFLFVARNLL